MVWQCLTTPTSCRCCQVDAVLQLQGRALALTSQKAEGLKLGTAGNCPTGAEAATAPVMMCGYRLQHHAALDSVGWM